MRFENHTVLVTGAASGIGRATAQRLASEGGRIALVDRDAEGLEDVHATLEGSGHLAVPCDVTDEAAIAGMTQTIRGVFPSLNGVVHCAGIHWLRPLMVTDTAALLEMLTSHVVSSIAVARGVLKSRLADKEGCSIVWISSAAAIRGEAGTVAYAASKGALISAARALSVELARRKVRVNVVAPGVVRTPQSEAFLSTLSPDQVDSIVAEHLLGLGEPGDIAAVVAFLLSTDARWMTGTLIVADGGLTIH